MTGRSASGAGRGAVILVPYHHAVDVERLLSGLDTHQRLAVTAAGRPLCILAGAGSGKTRVLTHRIAHRALTADADPRRVLALTFTRKAAAELTSRLRTFGLRDAPSAGTFHATAYAQLRSRWAGLGSQAPTLLDRKGRILARVLGSTRQATPADLGGEIEWAKARLIRPDDYPLAARRADRTPPLGVDRIAALYDRYEQEKRKRRLVDFDDLLALCAHAIETDPSFAAAQRWQFRHLFVDEYQDVNPLQERLLRAWLGDRDDLCVVGDPNQAIYGWNGADSSFLTQFARRHPGAEVVQLVDSYRSTPQILQTAAAVLAGTGGRPRPLRANRPDGPVPEIVGYRTAEDEANGIARALRGARRPGVSWSSQAVLVRTNAQAALIESALRIARIPYRVRGSRGFLDEPEVRELLRNLERLKEPLATTLPDLETGLARRQGELGLPVRAVGVDSDVARAEAEPDAALPDPDSAVARQLAAHEAVIRLARELLTLDPAARTDQLPRWLSASIRDGDVERSGEAVSISTFHAAKGLEWPIVHLAGVEDGYVPISRAREAQAVEEERRLLYVAVTRAERVLRISWAQQRTFGERTIDRAPSPFLRSVTVALGDLEERVAAPVAASDHLAASRSTLASSGAEVLPGADPAVLAALRTWRAEVARRAKVSPGVVLSDRALTAVASARPTDPSTLSGLPGIGRVRADTYGDQLVALVREHAGEANG